MAYTILEHIGEDDPRTVIATTILAYSISSIFTGAVFYLMGRFRIGDLIGFFPRHILLGKLCCRTIVSNLASIMRTVRFYS